MTVASIVKKRCQAGFSLPMAMFVLVVLGMLGAAMSRIVSQGQDTVAREVVSMRALMAAESGAERALNQLLVQATGSCGVFPTLSPLFTWNMTGPGLAGCDAVVSCATTSVDGDAYFTIRSEGRCGPAAAPSIRIVEVQAR